MQRKPRLASPFGSRGEDGHGHRKRRGEARQAPSASPPTRSTTPAASSAHPTGLHSSPGPPLPSFLCVALGTNLRLLACLLGFDGLRPAKGLGIGFLLDREYGLRCILRRFLHSDSVINSSILCAALYYGITLKPHGLVRMA